PMSEHPASVAVERGQATALDTGGKVVSRPKVAVRAYNVDDRAIVLVNGQQVLEVGYGGESGWVDIGSHLHVGNNLVVFILDDFGGGWTYGFQLRQGGNTLWEGQCGVTGSQGCSSTKGSGHAFYKEY